MFVINARNKPTLRILEFLTVSPSVPKERYRALSPPPPVFLLHFKTKLQYYKESMGPDSSLPYSNFAQPAADKAIPLAYNWNGGESPQPSPPAWKNSRFWSSPSPLLQTQALETQVTPMEGEQGPFLFSSAPACSMADNWDLAIWWLYCTSCSVLGMLAGFFSFFRETGVGGFPLQREVHFVPVLLPKESSGPTLREVAGLIVVDKVKALFWTGWTPNAAVHSYSLLDAGD